jgi:acetyl-CoA C-acetyltransferase
METYGSLTMGVTAENLAEQYSISRREQDEFALSSQQKAAAAIRDGKFHAEIVPYEIKDRKAASTFDTDEHPRLSPLEKLATLPPVFKSGGTVTAGNSSGRNDGASALMIMSEDEAIKRGLQPRLRILAQDTVGVSPEVMGIGPVPATQKALQQAKLQLKDIDLIELNEAFAAQSLAVIKALELDENKVNVNGGAIALGHPLGATGAILMTKLMHEMERRASRYGLVTLCVAGGLGTTTIVENMRI